ncbi:hypothetical protein DFQ26_007216 [Actinomortierella ambigua]|nr:hypothetical protein DFQ26_007216 [Actinomortierella ambigua]
MDTPTWLNQLPEHSIFELNEREYNEWLHGTSEDSDTQKDTKNSKSDAAPAPVNNSTKAKAPDHSLQDLSREHGYAVHGLACMIVFEQELFVAVGRQVRHASLTDLKKNVDGFSPEKAFEFLEKKHHQVLEIESVDFDIRKLVLNQDGRLMAIVGDEKIVIAELPKKYPTDTKPLFCKSFVVGAYYHINKGPSKVVKVLWHPLSNGYTHLVVMTQDAVLRMYNLANNMDEPEEVYNFRDHSSNTYSYDDDEAASFCFGTRSSEWGLMTVYALMQNGDIYSMTPVLPKNSLLPATVLEGLNSRLEVYQRAASGLAATREDQLRAKWVGALLDSAEASDGTNECYLVRRPPFKHDDVARKGPYLLQPAPAELDDDDNRACDILSIEAGLADLIAVAHSSGKVDIFVSLEQPEGDWTSSLYNLSETDDGDDLPSLFAYESIDLGLLAIFGSAKLAPKKFGYGLQENRLTIANHPMLVADEVCDDTIYVYHATGAHRILFQPWIENLKEALMAASEQRQAGAASPLLQFFSVKTQSKVSTLVNTRPTPSSAPAPIIGLSVVSAIYLGYSLLILTSSLQLVSLPMEPRSVMIKSLADLRISNQPLKGPAAGTNSYENSLSEPGYDSLAGLTELVGGSLLPRLALPPGATKEVEVTEENLKFMAKMIQTARESVRVLSQACDVTKHRVNTQEAEYERQTETLKKCANSMTGEMVARINNQVARQDQQLARQRQLMQRADDILQKLVERPREQGLSSAEKEWVRTVYRNEKLVKGFDERRHKVDTQYRILVKRLESLQQTQREMAQGFGSSHPKRRYGSSQIETVETALRAEFELMETTVKMMDDLKTRLESLNVSDPLVGQ